MRKYFIASAAILMALVSCTKENGSVQNEVKLVDMSFTAHAAAEFKTLLDEDDMSVSFKAGESIAVIADGQVCKFTTEEGGKSAVFTGSAPEASVYYAVSPYSVAENATVTDGKIAGVVLAQGSAWCPTGTYADSKSIAVASSSDEKTFEFKNICALLKITVPEEVTNLKEMTFFARNGEAFAGTLTVNPEDASFAVTDKKTQTGASYTDNAAFAPGTYYIPILPCTCAKGFDVKCTYMDNHVTRGFNGNSITIARNKVINLGTVKDSKVFCYENFEAGTLPSSWGGNTNALSVVENPVKTSANNSNYVLMDDMHTTSGSTSGYMQLNSFDAKLYPTAVRSQYKIAQIKVYLGANKYYPRLLWNKGGDAKLPNRINGVTVSDQASWDAAVETDDWNVLEWDASQFGKSNLGDLSSVQFRMYVNWNNGGLTYDEATSNHIVYIDDFSFSL